ncbi:MAG: ABC transporter substrate-binding protein [Spirochaetes bacterium]|nr:ABC transporter substrate-binding protein [Spirochaetota bacterium]
MMFRKILIWIIFFFLYISHIGLAKNQYKIVFFNPEDTKDYWWNNASKIMQAACDDLDIELEIYHANRNMALMVQQFAKIADSNNKPDAVVFQSLKKNGASMLKIAEQAGIPAFIFNAGLVGEDKKKYKGPREVFQYWIGQILPDDQKAGYELAKVMFQQALEKKLYDSTGKIHVIGLDGTMADFAAIERHKGLMQAVKENPRVILHQTTSAGRWKRLSAKQTFAGLKLRYPQANVVWAANDPMALGAIDAIKESGDFHSSKWVIGSIDWIPDALISILDGDLSVSFGGHFLEAAWSIILIYDYLNGIDFASENVNFKSIMGSLNYNNIDQYLKKLGKGEWEVIDFACFSKKKNPQLLSYHFTIDSIFQQLKQ